MCLRAASHTGGLKTVTDSRGDGADSTSAGYVEGVVGNLAKDFDGVDDGVSIPDLFSTGQSMSVAFWLNADSLGSDDRLMAISEQYEFLANIGRAGNDKVGVRRRGSNGSESDYGFRTVSTGACYYYEFTFDSESGNIVVYIDETEEFLKSGVGSSPIRG